MDSIPIDIERRIGRIVIKGEYYRKNRKNLYFMLLQAQIVTLDMQQHLWDDRMVIVAMSEHFEVIETGAEIPFYVINCDGENVSVRREGGRYSRCYEHHVKKKSGMGGPC